MKDDFTHEHEENNPLTKKAQAVVHVENLLTAYADMTGSTQEPGETLAVDILTDLVHWADMNGLSMEDLAVRARAHFEAETDDEDL